MSPTIDPQSQTFILNAIESLRNEMVARFDASNDKIDGVNTRLDTLNGKTAKNTLDIGRIKFVLGGTWSVVLVAFAWGLKRVFGG